MRAGSPAPISWCGSPGWMSPCTPRPGSAHRGTCRGRAHRSCGGRRLRRPGVLPAAFPGLRLLPQPGRQTRRPQRQKPDIGGGAQNPAPLPSQAARARRRRPGAARSRTRGGGRLTMRCARALPIPPLMPVASSLHRPVATPLVGGLPGKIERPHPFGSPHVGHPIDHHVAGLRPWTQIRLGAGMRNVDTCRSREGRR